MFRKIQEEFQTDLELCFKYDAVFKLVKDFNQTLNTLEIQRKKLNQVKGEIEESIFCDAIGEWLMDEGNFNRYKTDYLPYWFSPS